MVVWEVLERQRMASQWDLPPLPLPLPLAAGATGHSLWFVLSGSKWASSGIV